jgi:hypothetical protein
LVLDAPSVVVRSHAIPFGEAAWNMFSWRRVVRGVNDYQTVFNRLVSGLNTSSDWRRSTIKPFGSMKTIPDGSDLI